MAERSMAGHWSGCAIIRKLLDNARSIEEDVHVHSVFQYVLSKLCYTLEVIKRLIDDDEGGLTRDHSHSIFLWMLKDVLYDVDDLLDTIHLKIIFRKLNGDKKVRSFPSFVMSFKKPVQFRRELKTLHILQRKLKEISTLWMESKLMLVDNSEKKRTKMRFSSSMMPSNVVIVREDEKEEIVRILLNSGGEPESWDNGGVGSSTGCVIDVVPLVGIGGIGKTTLAQLVYNDQRVEMHFDTRMWCWISNDFDIKQILKELLYILSYDLSDTISDMETIIMKLKLAIANKKFLIVFDDVWDEIGTHWEMLHNILTCGAKGSKVLVTTRSARVAYIMGTMDPIMVGGLSVQESWDLFTFCAFRNVNLQDEERNTLQYIGMKICRKLGGLPLAAKTVGSQLRTRLDENYWRIILESELWAHDFFTEGVLSTLKLSYQLLNADLKQCFSYCSIFPRGCMFEKHKLVQMWLAQGYILPDNREEMTLEDIGSQWFDELVDRSFFQPAEGNRYIMHDLMHDLAVSVSLDDCSEVDDESKNIPHSVRHLVVRTDKLDVLKEIRKFRSLRTLLFFGDYNWQEISKVLEDMLIYLRGLCVLDLSSTPIKKLPDSFSVLSHLRYLDISNTKIRLLPRCFSKLCHLQVLNLQGCHFQELPKGMNKLINLRYLYGDAEIVSLIEGIGELTNLRCIEEFPVREKRGHGIGELENLKNLQGRLTIKNLENVKTKEEAMKAELKNKMHLNALQLEWSSPTRNRSDVEKDVLEGLQPHPNLKELTIICYGGIVYPDWMVEKRCLINLVRIHLHSCHRWENLPSFGQLPSLRILHFEKMPALNRIGDRFYGNGDVVFPSLEQVTFLELKNLKEWSEIVSCQFLPCLRKIQIKDCCSLTKCPFGSIHSAVEELVIHRCGDLGIQLHGCLQCFTSLTLLVISHYHHKTSISLSNLNALEELNLEDCPELSIQGGLYSLVNLKKLHIEGCPMLNDSSLPKQPDTEKGLRSLTDLCVDDSILFNDGCVLLGSLSSLRILNFQHFNHLGYFSKEQELWFHQLTSIQELGMTSCRSLECLPAELSALLSLKKLTIMNCPKIMYLPENGLPISLKELRISGCPALEKRCSREDGPDWPKIARIRCVCLEKAASDML